MQNLIMNDPQLILQMPDRQNQPQLFFSLKTPHKEIGSKNFPFFFSFPPAHTEEKYAYLFGLISLH